jgi:hypothetical protein
MNSTRTIATFLAACRDCAARFPVPLLSDQEGYGEFIARGRCGRANAYLNSFEAPWPELWGLATEVLREVRATRTSVATFQNLISRCIDAVEGEALSIGEGPFCPACRSDNVEYGDAFKTGSISLPYATCTGFQALRQEQKQSLLKQLAAEIGV